MPAVTEEGLDLNLRIRGAVRTMWTREPTMVP